MSRWIPVLALSVVAACGSDGRTLDPPVFPPPATTTTTVLPTDPFASEPIAPEPAAGPLQVVAPWRDGADVPVRYTCDGENVSPALSWTNVPAGAVELAVSVTDLDAPQYVHWVVLGIDAGLVGLVEGAVPPGTMLWTNGGGSGDYGGPCPPAGEEHRYLFTLHALNRPVQPADEMGAVEVVEMLNLASIDQSAVAGVYIRGG